MKLRRWIHKKYCKQTQDRGKPFKVNDAFKDCHLFWLTTHSCAGKLVSVDSQICSMFCLTRDYKIYLCKTVSSLTLHNTKWSQPYNYRETASNIMNFFVSKLVSAKEVQSNSKSETENVHPGRSLWWRRDSSIINFKTIIRPEPVAGTVAVSSPPLPHWEFSVLRPPHEPIIGEEGFSW